MDEIIQIAKECAFVTGSHPPTVFVYGTEDKGVMLLKGGNTPEARQHEMFLAGRSFSREKGLGKLRLVCFVSEGWMAFSHNGKFVRPSKDPERIEALIFDCLEIEENKQTLEVLKMERNPQGELTDFWTVPMPKDTEVQSNMLAAFMAGYQSTSRAN